MDLGLKGRAAIVTGASSGIGLGCATKLAQAGMAVLGVGRDERRLAELQKAIDDPDRVATIAVDLTDDDAPQRIVDLAVKRWGHVDFVINNAGVGSPKPLHETDDESLDYFLNLMLRVPFRLAREVIPHMPPGSAIINVTSTFAAVGGLRGAGPGQELLAPVAAQQFLARAQLTTAHRPTLQPGFVRMTVPVRPDTAVGGALRTGDVVTVLGRSQKNPTIEHAIEEVTGRGIPEWLSFDGGSISGRVVSMPTREQINLPVQEQLIVELYSK